MCEQTRKKLWTKFNAFCLILMILVGVSGITGCGEKEPKPEELVLGNWTNYRNRTYVLLIINPKGTWTSSVRIADVTSKIVRSRGKAKGTWHLEEGQLIFTTVESDIEEVWENNETSFFEIVDLQDRMMVLKGDNGRAEEWKKTGAGKSGKGEVDTAHIVPMKPFAINLNKHSSNAKDRYLCLKVTLALRELMPDQKIPTVHPRARDAAILFLSSLVYGDVENFEKIKLQKKKLMDILNPYMDGVIKEVNIEHVVVATSITKVEEFIIEHTIVEAPEGAQGEDGAEGEDGNPEGEKQAS